MADPCGPQRIVQAYKNGKQPLIFGFFFVKMELIFGNGVAVVVRFQPVRPGFRLHGPIASKSAR